MLRVLIAIAFAVQLVVVPWRHLVVLAHFDGASYSTTSYRPIWARGLPR